MSHQDVQYPKDATNSVKRHRERGIPDYLVIFKPSVE